MIEKLRQHRFLFEELVKRGFQKEIQAHYTGHGVEYPLPPAPAAGTGLGLFPVLWRNTPHYVIYIFCGNLVFSFFSDATKGGMGTIMGNAGIFTKVNVPKYLFLLSRNVQALINFGLILIVFSSLWRWTGCPSPGGSSACSIPSPGLSSSTSASA